MPDMIPKPFEVIAIDSNSYRIEDNGVRTLLFVGSEKAMLVDTGFGNNGSIKAIVDSLTDKPIILVNTHADDDHTGCNHEFDIAYMHPAEFAFYYTSKPGAPVAPLWEGDIIDIGGREFEVIHIPGHTPGSIALLDRKNRMLIGGDSVSFTPVFMFTKERSIQAHSASMEKLLKLSDAFDVVYASHGEMEIPVSQITKLLSAGRKIYSGEVEGTDPPFPLPTKIYAYDGAAFFYNR